MLNKRKNNEIIASLLILSLLYTFSFIGYKIGKLKGYIEAMDKCGGNYDF